ncbi:iron export ABC transporter permease subunit FetB [Venenivibrio stagnispumantis]|uniref:ABC transport system permease protein n=1 Tax=Venenivibrio stagnispumantis TaxID=407998 RepID=A0AA45WMB9_9AQUI|nr:iron export ABC transporter permease subunit FetB [Venenivibrio stagnispumantis]MCW4572813.1 iron export ABC transporter permease subunit FetB [Venenivibrio stagnispumantis]SMP13712.1 putative ABC transport system permease protein [Venenivibrio stagnispumantis]
MELKFLASYFLVLLAIFYSYKEKLGIEKLIIINSIRAFIQLLILGYSLHFIFKLQNPVFLFLILLVMCLFATYTAQRRINLEYKGYEIAFLTITLSSFLVLFLLIGLNIIDIKPNQVIPIGGMIIGNALNTYTLFIDRLKSEIKNNIDIIEGFIALGATLKQALYFVSKQSIKSSLIPIVNNLQTVGIIWIPGVAVGMLLAGEKPFKVMGYQLTVMYMMLAVALFTAIFGYLFSYKYILRYTER